MIIYNSSINIKSSRQKDHKYRNHSGFGYIQSRSDKVKTPSKRCKVKERKLNKKNIKYLKSLGLKVKVN